MRKIKTSKESLVLASTLKKIAPRIGASVITEPGWHIAGQITFKNGTKSYFRYNTLDLNPVGASDIAKDKDYANFFMEKMGYPIVPKSKTFFSDSWAEAIGAKKRTIDFAYAYAEKIGFPVVVKPNSGSQGAGVAFVSNKKEFYTALKDIFRTDRIALIQKPVQGHDYRIVVLGNKVISAYERIPLSITGDGHRTITQLLTNKQREFVKEKRDTRIKINDPRIALKLKKQKLSLTSIPQKGEHVFLLDNANLSTGGDSLDVTKSIHADFKKLAIQLTRDMGLTLCGVDLMIDGDITKKAISGTYYILEINAAPGLDHYVRGGKEQEKIVEDLYLEVLKRLEKKK
ncbi:cyanophycin synthetase [Patescibacteria group bacterium]|nr:cyanophycin synthetase [Patescibacteria group bacterium]